MKTILVAAILTLASPAVAQEAIESSPVLDAALAELPQFLPALDDPDAEYAVAVQTIGGGEKALAQYLSETGSQAVADELMQAYRTASAAAHNLPGNDIHGIPVIHADEFQTSPVTYDWEALKERYPNVRALVRISWPALDRYSTTAIVRYEVISNSGPEWAAFHRFAAQPDGSWVYTEGTFGNHWQ